MLGALIGAATSFIGGQRTNEANQGMDRETRAWTEEMANTAHQREVSDLRKAGLNPILSAGGSGASVGSASNTSLSDTLTPAINTGAAIVNQKKDLELKDQEIHNKMEDTGLKTYQKGQAQADMALKRKTIESNALQAKNEAEAGNLSNKLARESLPHVIKKAKATGDWAEANELMGVIKSGAGSAKDVVETINPLKIKVGK